RTLRPWMHAGIPRFPWCRPLGCPSQGLGLEPLRLEDLVGDLVGDVSEVLDELDVLVVREIGLAAAFRCKSGPDDLRLPDRLHAFMLFRSDPAQEVRGLVHADAGDLAASDLVQGLRDEDSEQGLCVVLSCALVLGESAMEAQSSENVILEGVELGE